MYSSKPFNQPSSSKSGQHSHWNHKQGSSTLPRTKPQKYSSLILSRKPSVSIFPAQKPNSSPTLSAPKQDPRDSLHLLNSEWIDPYPLEHLSSVSQALTFQAPRLSPSPTSLCRGMSLDIPGGRKPSPVAKERCARSISILNTKVEAVSSKSKSPRETKHDVLDQQTLMDFTHPGLTRVCSMTHKESRPQIYESHRPEVTLQDSILLQGNIGLCEKESTDKYEPKPPPRNTDITAILKPNSIMKQQQKSLPRGATGKQTPLSESEGIMFTNFQREFQLEVDGLRIQSSPSRHRKCIEYPQNTAARFYSNYETYERMGSKINTTLPLTPPVSFSTECLLNQSTVLASTNTRRRPFGFSTEENVDKIFVSDSHCGRPLEENNIGTFAATSSRPFQQLVKYPSKHISWTVESQNTQKDLERAFSQSNCPTSKDFSCQSRGVDQKAEARQWAHRLNQSKTCLLVPPPLEATAPAPVECTTSKTTFSKSDTVSNKQQLTHKQHPKSHNVLNPRAPQDTGLSEKPGVPTKPPECSLEDGVFSWQQSVTLCPFNTNRSGMSSEGVFNRPSQPQHQVYQRPDDTTMTASPNLQQAKYPQADRALIMDDPEDPYYVTMYYPASVYVGEYAKNHTTRKTFTEQIP